MIGGRSQGPPLRSERRSRHSHPDSERRRTRSPRPREGVVRPRLVGDDAPANLQASDLRRRGSTSTTRLDVHDTAPAPSPPVGADLVSAPQESPSTLASPHGPDEDTCWRARANGSCASDWEPGSPLMPFGNLLVDTSSYPSSRDPRPLRHAPRSRRKDSQSGEPRIAAKRSSEAISASATPRSIAARSRSIAEAPKRSRKAVSPSCSARSKQRA